MEIRSIRIARKMSQKEVAEELRVKPPSVYAWEIGKAMPSAENLIKLADLFDCTTDELLGRKLFSGLVAQKHTTSG